MTKKELEQYRSISTANALKQDIEKFIDDIPDSVTKKIFKYKYLIGKQRPTWKQVAILIGGGNTAMGVRQRVSRYLANK